MITIWRLTLILKQRPFFRNHIFASAKKRVFSDLASIAEYQVKMQAALADFHQWAEIAQNEWPWLDLEETREFELDSDALFAILNEYSTDRILEHEMTKYACRYAIVQLIPYPETGEFANDGVVAVIPQINSFVFKLELTKYSRLTKFFRHVDHRVLTQAIKHLNEELHYLAESV